MFEEVNQELKKGSGVKGGNLQEGDTSVSGSQTHAQRGQANNENEQNAPGVNRLWWGL